VTVSETSYAGPFTHTEASCSGIATVTPASANGPSTSFTVTGVAAGQCDVTFKDSFNQTASTHVVVTVSGFTINSKKSNHR
jgi:hypothetical protein